METRIPASKCSKFCANDGSVHGYGCTTTNPTDWEKEFPYIASEFLASKKIQKIEDFIRTELQKAKEAGVREGREEERACLLNAFHGSLDLPHRCVSCGCASKLTWREAIDLNAIGGRCPDCVVKQGSVCKPSTQEHTV